MSRYRKTMAQAMNEGAIQMQIAALKKAYEPMRNKRISLDNANKLSQIFNRFDANKEMMKQLYKADIPFVSAMASSRLISKHNMKAQELMQIRKEGIETATEELQQINEIFLGEGVGHISGFRNDKEKANVISLAKQHGLKVDDSGSKLKISGNMRKILDIQLAVQKNGLKAEEVRVSLEEGKMKTIATMFSQGKSAEEIAKKMGLDVKTVKSILGEQEKIYEFKKMTVTIADPTKRNKAMQDMKRFGIQRLGSRSFRVDGKGADLNKYATDLKNFYGAEIQAECYTIDESADEDFYNPVTEACWVGYKQVGMKNKGGKQVPNCVPESVNEQDDSMTMAKDMKKKKEELPKKDDVGTEAETEKKEGDNVEKLKKDIEKKDDEIAMLKTKAETEKAKVAKKETEKMVNPETGEPLLQVGVAYKYMKDKMKKEKVSEELNKDDEKVIKKVKDMLKGASAKHAAQAKMIDKALKNEMAKDKAYAIGMATAKKKYNDEPPLDKKTIKKAHEIGDKLSKMKKENAPAAADMDRLKKMGMKPKKENGEHPAKMKYEQIAGLKKKAEKSGMPYSILKKVYDRGMAAWRGGHRPGATQQQWAFARVNSFVTKSTGTWGGADKDLAAKVKGSK